MKLIHISDIHLTENGRDIWGVSPKKRLDDSLNQISKIPDIDAIIISGDLSDDGSFWSYKYIDQHFSELGIPTYCCLGNHDDIENLTQSLEYVQFVSHLDLLGWRILFLNTVIPKMSKGLIEESELSSLEMKLTTSPLDTIIVMHHPPLLPGGWLNKKKLINENELTNVLTSTGTVKLILYGHIHCFSDISKNGILYHSTSSTCYAYNKDLPKYKKDDGQEGFSVISLTGNNISIENIKF